MGKKKIETDECPNCGEEIFIYKGWATFKIYGIRIPNAKWHCPNCGETGKLNNWEKG